MLLWLRAALSLYLLVWAAGSVHAGVLVVIVSSERSPAYVEAAAALLVELERLGVPRTDIRQQTALEFQGTGPDNPKLVVALGVQAALTVAKTASNSPVLCALLPRTSFEFVLRETGRRSSEQFSALFFDQPLERQLELVRLALPAVKNIGVLWGPESRSKEPAFKTAAALKFSSVVQGHVADESALFAPLKKVLASADVLLAQADPQVFNAQTIQNILLTSFRAQVPLVGFSPAYVRAGALLAVFSTPEQVGRQVAGLAKEALLGRGLPAVPLYPSSFSVLVNDHVARSLGLSLDAALLTARLKSAESAK